MLIEKVVVIAMGLVAVVPHSDRDQGVTVLMRDAFLSTPRAERTDSSNPSCSVHFHMPRIEQIGGSCKGDCTGFNVPSAKLLSLTASAFDLASSSGTSDKLLWVPIMQSVAFEGLTGRSTPHETDYWFRYGDGAAKVNDDCMDDAVTCPIVARFEMATGGVKACTLSEYRNDPRRSGPAGFVIEGFEAAVPLGREPAKGDPLAESYAVELATSIEAPLRLTARNFAGGRKLRTAELYPDPETRAVVLVVSNPPIDMAHEGGPCGDIDRTATAHSAVVYDLAENVWRPGDRRVPHMADKVIGTHTQPTCANYLGRYQLKWFEYPSNPSKCKPPGVMADP